MTKETPTEYVTKRHDVKPGDEALYTFVLPALINQALGATGVMCVVYDDDGSGMWAMLRTKQSKEEVMALSSSGAPLYVEGVWSSEEYTANDGQRLRPIDGVISSIWGDAKAEAHTFEIDGTPVTLYRRLN